MHTIQTTAHTTEDGTLVLRVPTHIPSSDVDVTVVIVPTEPCGERAWPDGFFESTAGAWEGEPLERGDQGEYPVRDPLE